MYKLYKHPSYKYVTVVEIPFENIHKLDFSLCNQPTETLDKFYKRQSTKPDIITNGGFFSMTDGITCFGFRDEGVSKGFANYPGVGITGEKKLTYGQNLSQKSSLRDFISAYPPLVENGYKVTPTYAKEIDYKARRTAIGWNDMTLFIVTVDNPGLKFASLSNIFLDLKAKYAINLDGGGSTRMLVNGKVKVKGSYNRPVDNVFCVYLKPVRKILHKVQLGAFKNKDNAENLLTEIKKVGFSDAYILYESGYYKVQVGAYSVKLNAERMQDNLKALGYKSIIKTYEE